MTIVDKTGSRKSQRSLLETRMDFHDEFLEQFLIHISSDSEGGDGGTNDFSTTSNSESKSSTSHEIVQY